MRPLLLSTLILFLLTASILAQDDYSIDKSFEECLNKSKSITAEMVRCREEARNKWEGKVNKYYNSLMDILDEDDKEKLEKTQSAWIKFKESEFEFIPHHYTDPGSYQGPTTAGYEMNIVRDRALQLQSYYKQAKEGRELMEGVSREGAYQPNPAHQKYTIQEEASEFNLQEEQFGYEEYHRAYSFLKDAIEKYYQGKNSELGWEVENIGIPNRLLVLEGYGLLSQREIISLRLEDARFRKASKEQISSLEKQLKEIEEKIKTFFRENIWVD